jgi:hypothetical protein
VAETAGLGGKVKPAGTAAQNVLLGKTPKRCRLDYFGVCHTGSHRSQLGINSHKKDSYRPPNACYGEREDGCLGLPEGMAVVL